VREYEFTFVVQPEITEEGLEGLCHKFEGALEKAGATRLFYEDWGRRRLAYEIQKFQKGHYMVLHYLDVGAAVPAVERVARLEDSVLRFLTVLADDSVTDIEARKVEAVELEDDRKKKAAERAVREAEEAAARIAEEEAARKEAAEQKAKAEAAEQSAEDEAEDSSAEVDVLEAEADEPDEASEPEAKPSEPEAKPSEPEAKPSEPEAEASEPEAEASAPAAEADADEPKPKPKPKPKAKPKTKAKTKKKADEPDAPEAEESSDDAGEQPA
jgi:small subunit ribosomal protein S6